jgi:hypothetical protein
LKGVHACTFADTFLESLSLAFKYFEYPYRLWIAFIGTVVVLSLVMIVQEYGLGEFSAQKQRSIFGHAAESVFLGLHSIFSGRRHEMHTCGGRMTQLALGLFIVMMSERHISVSST